MLEIKTSLCVKVFKYMYSVSGVPRELIHKVGLHCTKYHTDKQDRELTG